MITMKELRERSSGKTRALYYMNYWDGPISGVCLWEGHKQYFEMSNGIDASKRIFTVYETPAETQSS